MIPMTLGEIAEAVGGRLAGGADPAAVVTGPVVIDSRRVRPGGLFVAVPGERVDGHDYAGTAVAAGAVAVLGARPVDVPCIVVPPVTAEDTGPGLAPDEAGAVTVGLGRLAAALLRRLPGATVVAITGSAGKTSTKDLVATVLETAGPTVAPPGSFNNDLGLPLTVLTADETTRFLVLEMGSRGIGHVARLCRIAPPRVSVALNVGTAHLGEFGSRETIAQAKGEIVEALTAEGTAVLNADDPLVLTMAPRSAGRVLPFGRSSNAEVRAESVTVDRRGCASFRLVTPDGTADVALDLVGEHQVSNALAAAAVAHALGLDVADVAAALSGARPRSPMRMAVTDRADGLTVVDDSYNANPDSMKAALKSLAIIGGRGPDRRRTWAVLGEMAELGPGSIVEHDAIGRLAVRLDISRLVAVGEAARPLHHGASMEGSWNGESVWVPDAAAALALVRAEARPGDVVLVKASRVAGLDRVATGLLADPPPPPAEPDPDHPAATQASSADAQTATVEEDRP